MAASCGRAQLPCKKPRLQRDQMMSKNSSRPVGRHFLHIPGPTPLPDRVLRAMDTPIIDHRGPEFAKLAKSCLDGIKTIFKTTNPVIIYTATGTGAWEAALVNTLSPGDRVLMVETGQFATLWKTMAEKLGLRPEFITTDWRIGADPAAIEEHLRRDRNKEIKAVCVLHNETSTGCLSPIADVRKAIDAAGRHVFQRGEREGVCGGEKLAAGEVVLGLGRHARHEQDRFLSLHPGDADAAWARRRHRHAARGGTRERVRAPPSPSRGDAAGGARLGARDRVPRRKVLFADGHSGAAAGWPRRRRVPPLRAGHLQHLLRLE